MGGGARPALPGPAYRVTGCGSRREADRLVADAQHTYLQLTGCME